MLAEVRRGSVGVGVSSWRFGELVYGKRMTSLRPIGMKTFIKITSMFASSSIHSMQYICDRSGC